MRGGAAAYVSHLRLPFQLTLAPLFLWGLLLAGGRPDLGSAAAFISLHLFLYPGITAFNAVYDRDTGPVAGLAEPPPLPPRLLAVAIGLQLAGALLAAAVGPLFLAAYAGLALFGFGYSHPSLRWKASAWKSLVAVGLGQGALGFLAGWAAAAGGPGGGIPTILTGAAVAAATTAGLYPVTQIFQVDEDRARGDRTLAVALGPAQALRLGMILLGAAGAVASVLVFAVGGPAAAAAIAAVYAAILTGLMLLERRMRGAAASPARAYRRAMLVLNLATGLFLAFLLWRLAEAG